MEMQTQKRAVRSRVVWLVVIFVSFWLLVAVGVAKVWIKAQILGLTSVELTKVYLAIERERMRTNELIAEREKLLDPRRLEAEARKLGMVLPSVEEGGGQ